MALPITNLQLAGHNGVIGNPPSGRIQLAQNTPSRRLAASNPATRIVPCFSRVSQRLRISDDARLHIEQVCAEDSQKPVDERETAERVSRRGSLARSVEVGVEELKPSILRELHRRVESSSPERVVVVRSFGAWEEDRYAAEVPHFSRCRCADVWNS